MDIPWNEEDLERQCQLNGIGVSRLRDAVSLWGCRGVTPKDTTLWYKLNMLSQNLFERDRRNRILQDFCLDDGMCPYCHVEYRPTGGKVPTIYCPLCNARQIEWETLDGKQYARWLKVN